MPPESAFNRETRDYHSYVIHNLPYACAIYDDERFCGSGFLIAPDLIITNFHVYKAILDSGNTTLANCRFRFMGEKNDVWRDVEPHSHDWNWLGKDFSLNEEDALSENSLDYIILRLKERVDRDTVQIVANVSTSGSIFRDRSWISLFDETKVAEAKDGDNIAVIHHPANSTKFESERSQVDGVVGPKLYYKFAPKTAPQEGSSGSFCISVYTGRVIALHQMHVSNNLSMTEYKKGGISIKKIAEDLEKKLSPEKINYLKIRPEPPRIREIIEDPYKERVQELVDLLESMISNVSDEQRYIAYLLALPSGVIPQNNSLFGIISHLDKLKTGRYSVLDFLVILEKLYEKNKLDLISNVQIREWIEKALEKKENINDMLSLSRAYAEEYLKKRTINIYVDIDQDNASTNVYAPKVYLELMGKPRVCISDTQEFSEIRLRKDFIQKFEIFWDRKINKLIYELEPQIVRIEFGVNQDTLNWNIGRSALHSGSSSFRIGEKYRYVYRSLERLAFAPYKEALKDNLNSQYEALMFFGIDEKIPVLSKDKSKGHFQNIFYSAIVRDRKIVCIYSFSFKELPKSLRRIVYNGILNLGIPVFIWCISEDKTFDIAPFQVINSLDEFRNWLATVQMDDRQYFDVLFDDPEHLLKFKDEGDSHV